ncbi:MAG: hypothetical protein HC857_04490 [Synechococcales cyanobacterium RU_4_20]|nr:hypothetical protein [Synechococcales cyanobacterium RU_4_20]NJR67540.1 hypothetical protein [Synechococcales cyanobacterium CRU_2_2]
MNSNPSLSLNPTPEPLPLLPRSAWNSEVTRLKLLFKAKQALDREEQAFRARTPIADSPHSQA